MRSQQKKKKHSQYLLWRKKKVQKIAVKNYKKKKKIVKKYVPVAEKVVETKRKCGGNIKRNVGLKYNGKLREIEGAEVANPVKPLRYGVRGGGK